MATSGPKSRDFGAEELKHRGQNMAKSSMGAIEDSSLITLWEEEVLEAIVGWDDAYGVGAMEDTRRQPRNTKHSKTCLHGVVGTGGSKSGWKEERSNGKLESGSSQSPQMSLTKSLSATGSPHRDPKLASNGGSGFAFKSARREEEEDGEVALAAKKHMGCGLEWHTCACSTNDGGDEMAISVQAELEKLRSQGGKKGFDWGSLDGNAHKLQIGDIAWSSAVQAIKNQSGKRCDSKVTTIDLLKTAMDVGIAFPPPFHQSYFK